MDFPPEPSGPPLDLSKEELFELAKNSFQYSFLDELTKEKYISEVVSFYSKN